MELFIVRHGIAEERGSPDVRRDGDRALTADGVRKTTLAAEGLKVLGCRPGRIAASPLRRAEQTARIMAEVLSCETPVEICEHLEPAGNQDDLVAWLRGCDEESVMIVGHLPDLAETVVNLLSARGDFDVTLKKASVCCITFDGPPEAGSGCLEWLMQPRQLRALAHT